MFDKIKDFIFGCIDDLLDSILTALCNLLGFGDFTVSINQMGLDVFNNFTNLATDLLVQRPDTWNGGSGWTVVQSVNTTFIALGASLVVIFWCIGICTDTIDVRMQMRPEVMIKELAKLVLAEALVTNSVTFITAFFDAVESLINGITGVTISEITLPDGVSSYLSSDANFAECIGIFMLSLVFCVGATMAGAMILYHAYIRFFKVLIIVPYGSIALSTAASSNGISHTAIAYFKYVLSTILEAVTMMLAIKIGAQLISSGDVGIITVTEGMGYCFLWMVQSMFLMFVMLGAIKESSVITAKVLGS